MVAVFQMAGVENTRMNIPLKQHLTITKLSPTTGTSWFLKRRAVAALWSRVGLLMRSQEEQEEQPGDEPMPAALALLLRRVDELAAHHTVLEADIHQVERERECQGRNRHLPFLGPWWPVKQKGTQQEEVSTTSA